MECKRQQLNRKLQTENSKLKTKDSGQRDGKQVNKITKSKMKQNETKLNRKLQLAVGSHRQSNDLQLCANLFASSPRCLLFLRTRPLLVSAAPSRRTRAHHNSERLLPRQRHLHLQLQRRDVECPAVATKAAQHFDDAEICLALPAAYRTALPRPATTDWSQFSHSPPI